MTRGADGMIVLNGGAPWGEPRLLRGSLSYFLIFNENNQGRRCWPAAGAEKGLS